MARTITEIQNEIIAAVQGDTTLSGASSSSSTAIWRLWTRVIASAVWALEIIYDAFRADLIAQVEALRPHTLKWYQAKALAFQYGSDLPEDSDVYDNSLLTDAQVEAQQIVAQAAATEENGSVLVKVAKEVNSELDQLATAEYNSLVSYFGEIKDAGVVIDVINAQGDQLKITIDVYYDPLVLDSNGNRIDGTANTVVKTAVKAFLRELPFDGTFVKAHLVDKLQAVDGVYVPEVKSCQTGRFDASALSEVNVQYQPYAGYLRFVNEGTDLVINYISKDTL